MQKTNRELRTFILIFSGYSLLLGLFLSHVKHFKHFHFLTPLNLFAWFLAVILLLIYPRVVTPLNKIWDKLLHALHWINTRLLLGIIFFAVFSPIAMFRKIMHKDSLDLKPDPTSPSYRSIISFDQKSNDIRKIY